MKKTMKIPMICGIILAVVGAVAVNCWFWGKFEDPVGIFADHFKAFGRVEKITHPEYQEYVCQEWPKWGTGPEPSFCSK